MLKAKFTLCCLKISPQYMLLNALYLFETIEFGIPWSVKIFLINEWAKVEAE